MRWSLRSATVFLALAFVFTGALSGQDPSAPQEGRAQAAPWKPFAVPPSIAVQQNLQATPEGWSAGLLDRPHVLACITFYDGRPEAMASLVYDQESGAGPKRTFTWRFQPTTPDGIWIECRYAGTRVVLRKRLPEGVRECAVTTNRVVTVDGCEEIERIEVR
jgi:hypothetical protein